MAYTHPQQGLEKADIKRLRKELGDILRARRNELEKTQSALAHEVGIEFYTFISQVENGNARIPPDRIIAYARALKWAPRDLAQLIMKHYDPQMWGAMKLTK